MFDPEGTASIVILPVSIVLAALIAERSQKYLGQIDGKIEEAFSGLMQPTTQFTCGDLRRNFGMVLQDTWLFHGTILENIRYGRLDATDEEVIAAAKAAQADHFIRALPGGYQMELNEESSNVSQGQKQLLTIARALLADNPILILDEATSSVDTRAEHLIQAAMEELMRGRASFVIAHRLSTIWNADMILVMQDGDIVEQGNHEELIARNGFYAQLYNAQFEQAG